MNRKILDQKIKLKPYGYNYWKEAELKFWYCLKGDLLKKLLLNYSDTCYYFCKHSSETNSHNMTYECWISVGTKYNSKNKKKKNWIEIKEEMKSISTINVSHQMQRPKEC